MKKTSATVAVIKFSGLLVGIIINVILARVLGTADYGKYVLVLTTVALVSIPFTHGIPSLLVRETIKTCQNKHWQKWRGLFSFSHYLVFSAAAILSLISFLVLYTWKDQLYEQWGIVTLFAILLFIIGSLSILRSEVIRGFNRLVLSQVAERIIKPIAILTSILLLFWLYEINLHTALLVNLISASLALLVGWRIYKSVSIDYPVKGSKEYKIKGWSNSIVAFGLTGAGIQLSTQLDIFTVAIFMGNADVGIYKVAVTLATQVGFMLGVINVVYAGSLSSAYNNKSLTDIKHLLRQASIISILVATPVLIVFIVYGELLISTLFGINYSGAYWPLVILGIGNFIVVANGPIGVLLAMADKEYIVLKAVAVGLLVNIIFNPLAVYYYGIEGAAIATAISVIVIRVLMKIAMVDVIKSVS